MNERVSVVDAAVQYTVIVEEYGVCRIDLDFHQRGNSREHSAADAFGIEHYVLYHVVGLTVNGYNLFLVVGRKRCGKFYADKARTCECLASESFDTVESDVCKRRIEERLHAHGFGFRYVCVCERGVGKRSVAYRYGSRGQRRQSATVECEIAYIFDVAEIYGFKFGTAVERARTYAFYTVGKYERRQSRTAVECEIAYYGRSVCHRYSA